MSRRILICDDSATDRANLERIVRGQGFEVLLATSGQAGIDCARQAQPDLIFMDVNMSEMDGFAATRQLNKDVATMRIPIVMVTSKGHKADFVWARMQGARGYVVKPYADAQIVEQLQVLLELT